MERWSQGLAGALERSGWYELWEPWLRPWVGRGPLSGDVTQAIDTSFIRVTTAAAGDPVLERQIVEQVASYGRQLGRILDALDVLIRHTDEAALSSSDRQSLDQLQSLRADIEAAKKRAAASQVDRIVADIRALRRDPEANAAALSWIQAALDGDDE